MRKYHRTKRFFNLYIYAIWKFIHFAKFLTAEATVRQDNYASHNPVWSLTSQHIYNVALLQCFSSESRLSPADRRHRPATGHVPIGARDVTDQNDSRIR